MVEASPASPSSNDATERWLLPTVSLIALVAGMGMWAERHLGFGLRHPAWLVGVSAALTSAAGLVDHLFSREESKRLKAGLQTRIAKMAKRLRRPARVVLAAPVQVVLYVICLGLVASISSIVVVPGGVEAKATVCSLDASCFEDETAKQGKAEADGEGKVKDEEKDEKGVTLGKKPARFVVFTSPFGRTFRLKLHGFLPATFEVYPVLGRTIRPDEDLRRSPTILFRPGWEALGKLEMESGGRFVVCDEKRKRLAGDQGRRASFLVGHPQPLPSQSLGIWSLELASNPVLEPNIRAETLLDWSRPVHLKSEELVPEMRVIAEVVTRIGVLFASTELRLGRDRLTDVALVPVPLPTDGTPLQEPFCESKPAGTSG